MKVKYTPAMPGYFVLLSEGAISRKGLKMMEESYKYAGCCFGAKIKAVDVVDKYLSKWS